MDRILKFSSIGILLTVFLSFSNLAIAQTWFDKQKKKIEKKVDEKTDDILNGKKKPENNDAKPNDKPENEDEEESANGKGAKKEKVKAKQEQTIIKESDFIQNTSFAKIDRNDTRIKIANNLAIDIKGKYPAGYSPKWRFISYKTDLDFDVENYINKRSALGHDRRKIAIGSYNGKAVLRFGAFIGCDCFADIIINDSVNVLSQTPQTFKVTNFQRITNERVTGEPCREMDKLLTAGGWESEVTLSANENGDIKMNLLIENFRVASGFTEAGVSYRYLAKNITMENEMSAEKANGIIAAELEAKRKYADYVKKSEKQIAELMATIKTKYPGYNCISCFSRTSSYGAEPTTTKTLWSNGEVTEDYDLNVTSTMKIENKCNQELTFIGIQQLYDEANGYTYKDVTRTMEANYYYQVKEGLFMSIFTSVAGIDGDVRVYPEYNISAARIGGIQWIRVIGKKKP